MTSCKYLGITFTTDLSWHPHISNICAKTRRLIGLLYRRFYRDTSPAALLKLYLSYIRPHLEYSAIVWNPYLKQDIDTIENVQKFALRVCLKSWDCSYELLVEPSLPSMQQRRNFSSLCHLYKIYHGMTHFPDAPLEQHTSIYNTRSTDSVTFKLPKVCMNGYKSLFFPIEEWNTLPSELLNSSNDDDQNHTFHIFKRNLSEHLY